MKLTEREKAVVQLQILSGEQFRLQDLYKIAYSGSCEDAEKLADPAASASRWWRSKRVQEYFFEQKATYDARRAEERGRMEEDIRRQLELAEKGKENAYVDYSDPKNMLEKLNEVINEAQDPGDALDGIKLLLNSGIRGDEISRNNQVRAYLPLNCYQCPLYQQELEELEQLK